MGVINPMKLNRSTPLSTFTVMSMALGIGCSGKVAYGESSANSNVGGSSGFIAKLGSSGGSVSTGGSSTTLPRCNGMFSGYCNLYSFQVGVADAGGIAQSCDVPLNGSPKDSYDVKVAIDCQLQFQVSSMNSDAGNVDGFFIDYSYTPSHILLFGSSCDRVQVPGAHSVDIMYGGCSVE